MIPNIYIHEPVMFEHHRERQREMAQHRQGKKVLRQRSGRARCLPASVGALFLTVRTRLRRFEPVGKKVGYEHSRI